MGVLRVGYGLEVPTGSLRGPEDTYVVCVHLMPTLEVSHGCLPRYTPSIPPLSPKATFTRVHGLSALLGGLRLTGLSSHLQLGEHSNTPPHLCHFISVF